MKNCESGRRFLNLTLEHLHLYYQEVKVSDSTCTQPLVTKFRGWNLLCSSLQEGAVHAHLNWCLSQEGKNAKFLISFSISRKFLLFFHMMNFYC